MLTAKNKIITEKIESAFSDFDFDQTKLKEIAFHLTDWLNDLEEIYKLYLNIENLSDEEIRKTLTGFVIHVPNHLNAAHKLIMGDKIEDVFNAGIFEDEEE